MVANTACCLLCNATLANSRYRRNLLHGEGVEVKDVIRGLLKESTTSMSFSRVDGNFDDNMLESYMGSSNIVCKGSCFSSVSKYVKLKRDTEELYKKLLNLVEGSLIKFANTCFHTNENWWVHRWKTSHANKESVLVSVDTFDENNDDINGASDFESLQQSDLFSPIYYFTHQYSRLLTLIMMNWMSFSSFLNTI